MSGKEDEAVAILGNAVEKAQKDMKPHEAYEFEMLLVEMLTYKVLKHLKLCYFPTPLVYSPILISQ